MRHSSYILDDDGNPVEEPDPLTWARWYERADRVVARTYLKETDFRGYVSTVFLAINHAYHDEDPPILYETLVFAEEEHPLDQYMERYETREEAIAGHDRVVRLCDRAMALKAQGHDLDGIDFGVLMDVLDREETSR